jgi:uncharacterized protein YndB with AHSA1/START domain
MDSLGTFRRAGEDVTVEFSLIVPASAAQVWAALTDPSTISQWLANAEFDAQPGGKVHLVWDDENEMHGTVIVASAPTHLSYTWIEPDGTSELSFKIRGVDDETSQLVLTHRGTSHNNAPSFGAGWHAHLESLLQVLMGAVTSAAIRDARYEELRPRYVALMNSI